MIKTGKLTIVTERNFEEILGRLQKICNNNRMLTKYQVFKGDLKHEEKEMKHSSFGWIDTLEKIGNGMFDYKQVKKYEIHDTFFKVEKHRFRQEYDDGTIEGYNLKLYKEFKSYISMLYDSCCTLVISDGDKITFTTDGGAIIYTTDRHTRFDESKPITIYKETLIPNRINGKINNLKLEINRLNEEREKECEFWNNEFEKEMEYEECCEDYDMYNEECW